MENETAQPAETPADDPVGAPVSAEERLARLEEDSKRYLDNWRRAEADLQNFKKRMEQDRSETTRFAGASLIINLLPIVDDFERAFQSLDGHIAGMTWFDGIRLIYRKLIALLESAGVRPINTEGEAFDPRFHESVAEVEGEDGKVVSEIQRGYMLHDRVLRPAMVVVGKSDTKTETEGEPANG